jgi:two-component system response regulator HydG
MMGKILIVDDEETIRFAFGSILADEGHTVVTAGSYEEALAEMSGSVFDLYFVDVILGDRTGIEILVKARERSPASPVVMITGYPTLDTASQAIQRGAFDYIPKPIRHRTLLEVTGRALRHKALVEEKERYRSHLEAIFRSVQDAIVAVDDRMVVTEANEAAREICGISRDAIGSPFASSRHPCRGNFLEILREVLREERIVETRRLECQAEGGPKRVVSVVGSPLRGAQEAIAGAVLVVKDETRLDFLERDLEERREFHNIVGKNPAMQRIYSRIEDLADVSTTVLITGETGTGKELVAQALHFRGSRRDGPFVKLNCSALAESLLESELFGHVKGAFTGALQDKVGRFERADGGTIFLDEIGDIPSGVQARLLRVLQEKEFERVGSSVPVRVDVRIVAATNKDLRERMKRGLFRDDLFYRLNVMEIHLPPLRKRKEDIPLLVDHYVKKFNDRFQKEIVSVSSDVHKVFAEYPWPGNVRELEHALEHAFIICGRPTITVDHLPKELMDSPEEEPVPGKEKTAPDRDAILAALQRTGGNKAKAARLLGIGRQTIYRKIGEYGIEETDISPS